MPKPSPPRSSSSRPGSGAQAIGHDGPTRGVLLAAWAGILVYVVLFFAWPLASDPAGNGVVRRAHVLLSLFFGDEVVRSWFEAASWAALAQRLHIVLAATAIAAVALAAGWVLLRIVGLDRRLTMLERLVFSAGVGLNVVSTATLALGLCGVLERWVFVSVGAVVLVMAGVLLVRGRGGMVDRGADPPAEPGADARSPHKADAPDTLLIDRRWLWCGAPFVLCIVLGAMLPPFEFDVREYHLQAPKEFFLAGRIGFLPHNVYANMPLGTEMLSLSGMVVVDDWWLGALVGKTLIALFAPLGALALLAAGRRFAAASVGIVAALVYISIPWIALVSMQGLVDGAMAFYLFAALYAVMLWRASIASGQPCQRWLWLAGYLAGGAVATKYPALLFCMLPLAAVIGYTGLRSVRRDTTARTNGMKGVVVSLAAFTMFVVLGCGLWLAKNAVLTGNPVYPLLVSVFDGRTRTPEKDAQWTRVHNPPNFELADLARRAVGVTLGSDWLSPLVMPLAALAFWSKWRRTAWWLAAYFGFVFFAWWLGTHRIDRFWIPMLPVVALLAAMGAAWTNARLWRVPFLVLLSLGLLANFVVLASGTLGDNRYFADLNVLRRDPLRVDPWHLYLNEHAGEVTGVLLVADAQPFDLEVPALYNTVFDDSIFEQLVRGHSPNEVRRALAELGISHVYVAWGEVRRYRSPGNYGITDFIQPAVFERLVAAGVLSPLPPLKDHLGQMYRVVPPAPPASESTPR